MDRLAVTNELLNRFQAYYNITLSKDSSSLVALCEYYEDYKKYVLTKKAELWSAKCEEFIYIISVPHLTIDLFHYWEKYVYEDAMIRLHIGPGHMYSYITPIWICNTYDVAAKNALKKCHYTKYFRFSLYGWMSFHTIMISTSSEEIESNRDGRFTAKELKKILYK